MGKEESPNEDSCNRVRRMVCCEQVALSAFELELAELISNFNRLMNHVKTMSIVTDIENVYNAKESKG